MCLPAAAGPLAPALIGVGAAGSFIGGASAASSKNSQLRYNAASDEANAQMAGYAAQDELYRGAIAEGQQMLETRRQVGADLTAFAGAGLDVTAGGSVADILSDKAYAGQVDALTIRSNAARAAWSDRAQQQQLLSSAAYQRKAADANNPLIGGVTSLLGTATSVAPLFMKR